MRNILALLLTSSLLVPTLCFAGISTEPAMPIQHSPVLVRVEDTNGVGVAGIPLVAEYYPSTELTRQKPACTTDANGVCTWTPDTAGLVRILGQEEQLVVSVLYEKAPLSAIVVFLVAAFTLIGTLSFGVYRLNQSSRAD